MNRTGRESALLSGVAQPPRGTDPGDGPDNRGIYGSPFWDVRALRQPGAVARSTGNGRGAHGRRDRPGDSAGAGRLAQTSGGPPGRPQSGAAELLPVARECCGLLRLLLPVGIHRVHRGLRPWNGALPHGRILL